MGRKLKQRIDNIVAGVVYGITWVDSYSGGGWTTIADFSFKVCEIVTYGTCIKNASDFIAIAPSIDMNAKNGDAAILDPLCIPKGAILNVVKV